MLKGLVIGACAGARATTVALGLPVLHAHSAGVAHVGPAPAQVFVPFKAVPRPAILTPVITLKPGRAARRPV
jgi:hypothetical protein